MIFPVLEQATGEIKLRACNECVHKDEGYYTDDRNNAHQHLGGVMVHKKEEHGSLLFKHENCILRKYFQSSS